jgi:hypothetical protein
MIDRTTAPLLAVLLLSACGDSTSDSGGATPAGGSPSDGGSATAGAAEGGSPAIGGATTGDGGDGGAAPPACTALLCEDFEAGAELDASKWTADVGYHADNVVTIQSDMVAHGGFAAHAHLTEVQGGFAMLREAITFPALADSLWGRAYFYTTLPGETGHTGFFSAYAGDNRVFEVGAGGGTWQLTYYPAPGSENPVGYPGEVPTGEWVCVEWHFDRLGSPRIEIFIDGESAAVYENNEGDVAPLTAISLGIDNHSATVGNNDVYLDDIAIDAERVGCLP